MNSKVGTDQAVGNTAWHADTGRERLQQGFHVIVCNVRPHLSLRLGTASVLPFLRSIVTPARVQPSCLLSLLLLKTVSERGASARVPVTSKGVPCDSRGNLHIAVLFRFLSQSRVPVRVAGSVTLGSKEIERPSICQLSKQFTLGNRVERTTKARHAHTRRVCTPRCMPTDAHTFTRILTAAPGQGKPATPERANCAIFTQRTRGPESEPMVQHQLQH